MSDIQTKTVTHMGQDVESILCYDDKAIKRMIGDAAVCVPGVLGPGGGVFAGFADARVTEDDVDVTRGITVHDNDGRLSAEVLIITEENTDMQAAMDDVKAAATAAVEKATGLPIDITVEIVDTMTSEAYAERFRDA